MTKTLASLIMAVFAAVALNAQAASHAGGAPMPDKAASGAKAGDAKKDAKAEKKEEKKEEKKDAKKEETKK